MPRGSKDAYTDKQKRMAEHIEDSYESRGTSDKEAERRAWATVNKETGGGRKSGSGRKSATKNSGSKSAAKKTGTRKTPAKKTSATRKSATKKSSGRKSAVRKAGASKRSTKRGRSTSQSSGD